MGNAGVGRERMPVSAAWVRGGGWVVSSSMSSPAKEKLKADMISCKVKCTVGVLLLS